MRRRMRRMHWRMMCPEFGQVMGFLGAISGPRWLILRVLGDREMTTSEIYGEFVAKYGYAMPRSLLYYHLGELERMGIIEMVGYRETGKGGAPEKVWRLKIRRIVIDILRGKITVE